MLNYRILKWFPGKCHVYSNFYVDISCRLKFYGGNLKWKTTSRNSDWAIFFLSYQTSKRHGNMLATVCPSTRWKCVGIARISLKRMKKNRNETKPTTKNQVCVTTNCTQFQCSNEKNYVNCPCVKVWHFMPLLSDSSRRKKQVFRYRNPIVLCHTFI